MSEFERKVLDRCVETPEGCWVFLGAQNGSGYGRALLNDRGTYTHRASYEFFRAQIPEGLHIDHLCRNPPCCNPWHLEPVTCAVNIARGVSHTASGLWRAAFERAKTACPEGHPYDDQNTYVTPEGHRQCLACKRAASQRYRARSRERINSKARARRGYEGPIAACRRAGHAYTEENTYVNPSNGRRVCRACMRERMARNNGR